MHIECAPGCYAGKNDYYRSSPNPGLSRGSDPQIPPKTWLTSRQPESTFTSLEGCQTPHKHISRIRLAEVKSRDCKHQRGPRRTRNFQQEQKHWRVHRGHLVWSSRIKPTKGNLMKQASFMQQKQAAEWKRFGCLDPTYSCHTSLYPGRGQNKTETECTREIGSLLRVS